MGMLSLLLQVIAFSTFFVNVKLQCEDGTCRETRDMDHAEEENVADRYLRRSNELLTLFSKDVTSEKRRKRSNEDLTNIGDEIRDLEDLVRRYKNTQNDFLAERHYPLAPCVLQRTPVFLIRLQLLTLVEPLCDSLEIMEPSPSACSEKHRYRTLDGSCNNLVHPAWGKSSYPLLREFPADYDDGVSEFCTGHTRNSRPEDIALRRDTLPSAREVVIAVTGSDPELNPIRPSQLVMHFAQFIDHDIVHVPVENVTCNKCVQDEVCFPIGVPKDDPVYTNLRCLEFKRSRPFLDSSCSVNTRIQENQITSYLDSSNVYGSNDEEGEELRNRTKNKGQMKVNEEPISQEHLPVLPNDEENKECTVGADDKVCGKGGDVRAAEQPGLTGIHTILVREHNRIALELSDINGHWDEDRLYHEARKIVNALYQHIIYNEFLPIILGHELMDFSELTVGSDSSYAGYRETLDATATNVFSTAAYRFGHSFVPTHLKRVNSEYEEYPEIPLREAFFNATYVHDFENGGVDSILLGMVDEQLLKVDRHFSEDISSFLFVAEDESFGMDLVSLNIQRGRDHGLPSYAEIYEFCHREELNSFSDMKYSSRDVIRRLRNVYDRVQDIDPFIGMVTEEPIPGAAVGRTAGCIIARQFHAFKYGDRFWYENNVGDQKFEGEQIDEIRKASYARLLCDNLVKTETVQPYAFMMPRSDIRNRYDSFVEFSRIEKYPLENGRLPGLDNRRVSCTNTQAIPKINLDPWRESL